MRNNTRYEDDTRYNLEDLHTGNNEEIVPFPEEPRVEETDGPRKRVAAGDLFSLFTADIIKMKTLFSR